MKKLMKIFVMVLVSVFALPMFANVKSNASATNPQSSLVSAEQFESDINDILTGFLINSNRIAGTQKELDAANYIKNYLGGITNVKPKSTPHVVEGVQTFTFESNISGLYNTSQNIIFEYNPQEETAKKVIVACHYDSIAYKFNEEKMIYEEVSSESLNGSAASVAFLLALAKNLPYQNINYNIEFVFFGAGESNNAGSNIYVQGLSAEEKENILCMINIDEIALGKNVYFYVDEIDNKFSNFVNKVASDNKLNISKVESSHLNKVLLNEVNELGLNYTHIALQSDNINFMKSGITTLSVFAGDYEEGVVIGKSEFGGDEVVTFTENDSLAYISENIGMDLVNKNLFEVYKSVGYVLTDADFVSVALDSQNSSKAFYAVFGNKKLVVYLTAVAFVVFVIVAMYIYYKLSIRAYNANVEIEFLSTVVKISEQIDKDGVDSNVPKVISQVIANDIKKDKTIKRKRKDDEK